MAEHLYFVAPQTIRLRRWRPRPLRARSSPSRCRMGAMLTPTQMS